MRIFASALKPARVTPIFNGKDRSTKSNYCPISVLPMFIKIFEGVIRDGLEKFLNAHDIFYGHQYGFRSGSGMHTATFELVDDISKRLNGGVRDSGLFIGLPKAFDYVLITKYERALGVLHTI